LYSLRNTRNVKHHFFYKSKQQHLIQEDLPQALGMEVTALLGLKGSFFFAGTNTGYLSSKSNIGHFMKSFFIV